MKLLVFSFVLLAALPRVAVAEEVLLAVASNFVTAAEEIATAFEASGTHDVVISHGSTGALYAQITQGAPFDIFLAADDLRPARLREDGLTQDVRTYALGRLVLVSRTPVDLDEARAAFAGKRVALADPLLAPYGTAALAAMEDLRLDTAEFQPLLVTNVGQVATLFVTGNADLAFLAQALVPLIGAGEVTSLVGRYPEIRQDGTLLRRAAGNPAAEAFWTFLATPEAADIIVANGYDLAQ